MSKKDLWDEVYDAFEWKFFDAKITDEKGEIIFEQHKVEAPEGWSQQAVNIVASKYFYGKAGTSERETSVMQLVKRVCKTIARWGWRDGYFKTGDEESKFAFDLSIIMLDQRASFNSPVWFNVGLWDEYEAGTKSAQGNYYWNTKAKEPRRAPTQYVYPQCSACFIQSLNDDMESIMNLAMSEAMLFKHGSGTGTDLSTLRSKREELSGGGKPSGPMSFLKIYDRIGDVVKSGGKTRRAAKMNTLCDWHGDIEEFIDAKQKEEKKAWALIEQGYDGSYNGDAYGSVAYQNENLSVRATDEFMEAAIADREWKTRAVTTGKVLETKRAKTLLHKIAEGTHICGDPGMQFDSAIQKWHTCKKSGRINSTNPCSEYVFLDETACNLASINLMKFRGWPTSSSSPELFDIFHLVETIKLLITAMDIIVDRASYPTAEIARKSHQFRTLGLGYANLGALIMSWGLPYDSDEARSCAGAITSLLTAAAYDQSGILADSMSPFEEWLPNKDCMREVLEMHQAASKKATTGNQMWEFANEYWQKALKHSSYRNAQVSVIAPTGTIAFMMDCDTTGIEPDIALVKYKLLAGGGMLKIVNKTVDLALQSRGYSEDEIASILDWIEQNDTIEGSNVIREENLNVFDCAFKPAKGERSIHWRAHLKMMAACQPFVSGAISKTINMPSSSTIDDIQNAYIEAWKMGLKCVAIYRDGSKRSQPLNTSTTEDVSNTYKLDDVSSKLKRRRLSPTRKSITHKFKVGEHEGYLSVGLYEDGSPGELFIVMSKQGSTIRGLMDSIGMVASLSLQYGVPLDAIIRKLEGQRFEPSGITDNQEIKFATSLVDYIFKWMKHTFSNKPVTSQIATQPINQNNDAPLCPECGVQTQQSGACFRCANCGASLGCS